MRATTVTMCLAVAAVCVGVVVVLAGNLLLLHNLQDESHVTLMKWSIAQWLPENLASKWQSQAWQFWDKQHEGKTKDSSSIVLDIPVIDVQKAWKNPLRYLEDNYGKDWRKRPLLLKNLWTATDLASQQRRLSLSGLLQENMTIPYYFDSTIPLNLSPDAQGPIGDIMRNITTHQAPHKIGSQLYIQRYPELIREVAPTDFVTTLFGDYFFPHNIKGSGPFGIFPGLTTVPLFVAHTNLLSKTQQEQLAPSLIGKECKAESPSQPQSVDRTKSCGAPPTTSARTDLHCEPIGNVAVQLEGEKQWTLVPPDLSFQLRPRLAPDGRSFFASWLNDISHVPQYRAVTSAGDAMWVPTWTWHRVDYVVAADDNEGKKPPIDNMVAIGASLFHFRVIDFLENNPLFALLIIPSLIKELFGYNTQ